MGATSVIWINYLGILVIGNFIEVLPLIFVSNDGTRLYLDSGSSPVAWHFFFTAPTKSPNSLASLGSLSLDYFDFVIKSIGFDKSLRELPRSSFLFCLKLSENLNRLLILQYFGKFYSYEVLILSLDYEVLSFTRFFVLFDVFQYEKSAKLCGNAGETILSIILSF